MDWGECERKFIRKAEIDPEKINSVFETAMNRQKFVESIAINDTNVSFVFEEYYEIIKELLVALLLKNGLKSKNHQCLISYFYRAYPDLEFEVNLISQMSYFRNRLDYYGEQVDTLFYTKNKQEFIKIIDLLKKLVKG